MRAGLEEAEWEVGFDSPTVEDGTAELTEGVLEGHRRAWRMQQRLEKR